ncbi:hypothetical protein GT347_26465 [Xylophilus rhododendri]|uniref:Uncharacterized protein n=1 Tax=Xylophilus rhododendri TaxID=2697032 RepID=A0A857JB27_9BURK|nr:hypothetical protein [Xylophilus rhododendri]QHJ01221.1 hypothetical protein GT347_26465 [Xylophilus rhododendri]
MASYIKIMGGTGLVENGAGGFFNLGACPLMINIRDDGWSLRCMDPVLWSDFSYDFVAPLQKPWTKPRTESGKLIEGKIKLWEANTDRLQFQQAQEISIGGFGDTLHGEVPGFELRRNAAVTITPYPSQLPKLALQFVLLNE